MEPDDRRGAADDDDHRDERDAMRALLRDASAQADETPGPAVRTAVLAAATRDASKNAPVRSTTRSFGRRRWPLSAAALLVVSLVTGLVFERTLRDDPERMTTIARHDAATPLSVPAPAPPPSGSDDATGASTTAAKPGEKEPAARAVAPRAATPARPGTTSRAAPKVDIARAPSPAAATAEDPAAPAVRRDETVRAPAAASAAAAATAPSTEDAATTREEPPLPRPQTGAATLPAAPLARVQSLRNHSGVEPESPEAWVARIVALRATGDDDEAERELKALRARYPGFAVPATAEGAAGSR